MLKETETEETTVFFVTFFSSVAFQLGGGAGPTLLPGYAYDIYNVIYCSYRRG